jgi:hypothetical protein
MTTSKHIEFFLAVQGNCAAGASRTNGRTLMPNLDLQTKIKTALKEVDLPELQYRDLLYRKFRVSSEESLSDSQAQVLIGYLERLARGEALNREREECRRSRTPKKP